MLKYEKFIVPTLYSIAQLGGSGTVREIEQKLVNTDKMRPKFNDIDGLKNFQSDAAWARTFLKRSGYIDNSKKGVWSITEKGEIVTRKDGLEEIIATANTSITSDRSLNWQGEIITRLLKLKPANFEHLCMRVLREAGFEQIEVTGRSGDSGIDGKGIYLLAGLLSYRVSFQVKRYRGNVGSGAVRDFRGAMSGRSDKGMIISTGGFTPSAIEEATRDGVQTIDLIDGMKFTQIMLNANSGIFYNSDGRIYIDNNWFKQYERIK